MIKIDKIIIDNIAVPARSLTEQEKMTVIQMNSDATGYTYYQVGDTLPIIEEYETCEACLPQPEVVVETINYRQVKPGYNTGTCDPAYVESVYSKFADAAYKDMMAARYGVRICCEYDVTKWTIKQQLIQLGNINDPNYCT
jgi:hypothetical protein